MMGNSPLRYIETIFNNLISNGYEKEISTEILTIEIKKHIGFMNPKKIKEFIKTLEEFSYIKQKQDGFWFINWIKLSEDYNSNPSFKELNLKYNEKEELIKYKELIK